MNKYPLWKYLLIALVVGLGIIYSLPNLYPNEPAVQIAASRNGHVDTALMGRVQDLLARNELQPKGIALENGELLVRFADVDPQLKAYDLLPAELGDDYSIALNLVPSTPAWLTAFNAKPMYLGLDLRGGVHFLLEVDMNTAAKKALERYSGDVRSLLREEKLRYVSVGHEAGRLEVKFRNPDDREKANDLIRRQFREIALTEQEIDGTPSLVAVPTEAELRAMRKFAVQQNITTLRNRVNQIGVREPVIQQQGEDRIVVQLPGLQDPVKARELLGSTATLEYHMVDERADVAAAVAGRVPPGSRLYYDRDGQPHVLKKEVIVTGNQIIDAASGIDPQTGGPLVSVTLDGKGARRMGDNTKENLHKLMAVVFIETKTEARTVDGQTVRVPKIIEEVISVAEIQGVFSSRFQTTGLDSPEEARTLALLLRAGALAAPMQIVEERTVGPSLGAENIAKGFSSNIYGFVAIALFMVFYYRVFGIFSVAALAVNVVLLIALLSFFQATLTLPGMAGIALTVGMAIDANVLINERIREELRNRMTPHASINVGYERAFGTIWDSNITTLIAGLALFWLGSGPVRGFAVVLCLGILTSMFSAVVVSRAFANLTYGRKARLNKVSI